MNNNMGINSRKFLTNFGQNPTLKEKEPVGVKKPNELEDLKKKVSALTSENHLLTNLLKERDETSTKQLEESFQNKRQKFSELNNNNLKENKTPEKSRTITISPLKNNGAQSFKIERSVLKGGIPVLNQASILDTCELKLEFSGDKDLDETIISIFIQFLYWQRIKNKPKAIAENFSNPKIFDKLLSFCNQNIIEKESLLAFMAELFRQGCSSDPSGELLINFFQFAINPDYPIFYKTWKEIIRDLDDNKLHRQPLERIVKYINENQPINERAIELIEHAFFYHCPNFGFDFFEKLCSSWLSLHAAPEGLTDFLKSYTDKEKGNFNFLMREGNGKMSAATKIAINFFITDNRDEWKSALLKISNNEPTNAAAHYYLGLFCSSEKDQLDCFKKVLALDSKYAAAILKKISPDDKTKNISEELVSFIDFFLRPVYKY